MISFRIYIIQKQESFVFIGMQLPEKYKETFDVSIEDPSSVRKLVSFRNRRSSPCIFQQLHPPIDPKVSYHWHISTDR
jgi:hypothetical protein